MPITDNYVVGYLLQETRRASNALVWKAKDVEGYAATLHGVQMDLSVIVTRSRSFLCLTLTDGDETIFIQEPVRTAIFRARYESEDHRRLADLMRDLLQAITRQIAVRQNRRESIREITRQSIYQRLIGALETET